MGCTMKELYDDEYITLSTSSTNGDVIIVKHIDTRKQGFDIVLAQIVTTD